MAETDPLRANSTARALHTAVVDLAAPDRLSYRELDLLVDKAASWLSDALDGSPVGERVAYLGRNGPELLILALGAERCGAIFVPLNWRLTSAELGLQLLDCAPRLLIAQEEFGDVLRGQNPIIGARRLIEHYKPYPPIELSSDRPVILLYTSGTTGSPKGVIVTANNATAAAQNFIAVGELDEASVTFSDLPMFHTIGIIAVARSTIRVGATLVLSDRFMPARTLAALSDRQLGVTHYFAVPVMIEALEREPSFASDGLARLRAVFLGGAPLSPELIDRFLLRGIALVNGYGMSEVGTAIHMPIASARLGASAGSVGLPAPTVAVRLVTGDTDVQDGEVGEVWLKGPSVTPGYWNRPDETAAAFHNGWYRSGDLARRDADGFYHIVDRVKDMYVSGGENVYPAEVEAVLLRAPAVADAAVVGVPDAQWGETGVAFVVPAAPGRFDKDAVLAACAASLAKYKRPARLISIEAIPRNAAGKILKPVLRARLQNGEFK